MDVYLPEVLTHSHFESIDNMPRSEWPVRNGRPHSSSDGSRLRGIDEELSAAYAYAESKRQHEDDWMDVSDRW